MGETYRQALESLRDKSDSAWNTLEFAIWLSVAYSAWLTVILPVLALAFLWLIAHRLYWVSKFSKICVKEANDSLSPRS